MIGRLLRGTEWAKATDYLSPAFFQVVPTLAMGKKIATLAASYADRRAFAQVCAEGIEARQALGLELDLSTHPASVDAPLTADKEVVVLKLFFLQLLFADTVLLDLRRAAFSIDDSERLIWTPKPLFATLDPAFASAVRSLYRGFYAGHWEEFDRALSELGLIDSRDLFLEHFGASQSEMRFELPAFRKTFHEVFVRCKTHRTRLHPDFLAFGAALFCLYEHLERGGRQFDVRSAFNDAVAIGEGLG